MSDIVQETVQGTDGLQAFLAAYHAAKRETAAGSLSGQALALVSSPMPAEHRLRPFPGLRSFEATDSDVFFGRQEQADTLLDLLSEQQVIAVLGGSGSGKSSVVRAGVIPALTSTFKIEGRLGRWYVAVCKPGQRPVDELCDALWQQICSDRVLSQPNGGAALAAALGITGELRDRLMKSQAVDAADRLELRRAFDRELRPDNRLQLEGVLWFASDVLDRLDRELNPVLRSGAPSVMVVVDQFEELFGPDVIAEQRDDLLALLKRVFDGSKDKTADGLYVTVTMRSEQLHRCAEFPGLSEVINGSMYLIELLDEAGLREAIVRPARRVFEKWGLPLDAGPAAPFDPEFVDRLLKESSKLRDSLVHKPDQLPLLQHALRLVWDNAVARWSQLPAAPGAQDLMISFADEPESDPDSDVGFLRSCLNLAADNALDDAVAVYRDGGRTMNAERLLRAFFTALARRDDRGNWARRLVTWAELREVLHDNPIRTRKDAPAPVNEPRFEEALHVFVARGYLAPRHNESDGSRASYEVCHEALIRHWRQYEIWLEEADETARALREVAQNLLSLQDEASPLAWPDLRPYGYSPRDWMEWLGAVRERRAAGVVSEFTRAKISLVCGDGAKFGAQWALDQLRAFLRGRDVHRGDDINSEETYAVEARELLTGIENATALVPPRLMWSGTAAGLPRFVFDLVRHPDTRPFSLSGVVICVAAVLLWNVYQQQQQAELLHQAENVAAKEKIERLAHTRQIFGAQSVDTLLADDQIELARLVALTALDESPTDPENKLRQSLAAVGMAQGRGPLLFGTDASTTRIAAASSGNFIAGVLPPASQSDRPPVHRIQLWDPSSGATLMSLSGAQSEVESMVVSPDAKYIAAGLFDGEILVWNVSDLKNVEGSSKPIKQFGNSASPITALAFSQDGKKLIGGAADRTVSLWDVAKGERVKALTFGASCPVREAPDRPDPVQLPAARAFVPPTVSGIVAVALNAGNDRVLASTSDRRLILWDATTEACLLNYGAWGNVRAIAFGSDPVRAVLAIDRSVFVTLAADAEKLDLTPLPLAKDDAFVRSIGFDADMKQFSIVTGNGVTVVAEHDPTISDTDDSSRNRDPNATATTVRAATSGKSVAGPGATARPPDEFKSIQFVPKTGAGVVAADTTGRVLIVQADKDTKRPLQIVERKPQSQRDESFSIDAIAQTVSDDLRYIAVASDRTVIVRHLDGDRKEYTYNVYANVRSLGIDAANKRLAIGSDTGLVQLWSFETEKRPGRRLSGHNRAVNSIAFDKSGQRMVTASDDRRAIVWDLAGDNEKKLLPHGGPVKDAKFAADDIGVVTLSRDGALRRFDLANPRSGTISPGVPDSNEALGMALDRSRAHALVLDRKNAIEVWDLRRERVEGSLQLPEGSLQLPDVSAVGFWGEKGEILTVWPSGDLAIWSSDAGRLRAYSNLSSVVGGWNAVNPTKRNVLTFDSTRDIKFDPPPNEINENDVQAVVRAAVARAMTSRERQRYAPDKTDASLPALLPMQLGLRCDPNIVEWSIDTVTRGSADAKAWFDLGCARENEQHRTSGTRSELLDPSILVAAAMEHGPALASIGEWFASRKPRSVSLSSQFYRRAFLNDTGNGERYLDWLVRWGGHTRDAARDTRDLLDQRANAGDPAAHFIRGMVAEGNARKLPASPDESDELLQALYHFALADKLFKQRKIDEPTTLIRLGALARVLRPERVAEKLKEVDAWKAAAASPAPSGVQTSGSAGAAAPEPAWRPDLTEIDVTKEGDLHRLAVSAIDVLGRSLQLGPELDVLRAEYMLAQAKALGQNSERSPALLDAARERFEAELKQDDTDTRSFDRLDEVLATLARMAPAGVCDGALAARAARFEWPKPRHLVSQRRLAQIEAETRLGACFVNAGKADAARERFKKAADQVRETGEPRNLPPDERTKLAILAQLVTLAEGLADTCVEIGDRETAMPIYAHLLISSARGPLGRSFAPSDLQETIRRQQKAYAVLTLDPATPAMIPPFAGLAEALQAVGQQRSLESSKVQELYRGGIDILKRLTQIDPNNIEPQLVLWRAYGQLAKSSDPKDAVKLLEDAVAHIKTVSERNPTNTALLRDVISSQRQLGEKLQKDGDAAGTLKIYREALATARTLAERDPSVESEYWSDLYEGIGGEFEKMGDYRSAIDIYGQWVEVQPNSPSARNGRCWTRAIVGDLEAALADCDEANRLKPNYAYALDSRGFTYLKMGKFVQAIADYDAALNIDPKIAHSRYGRGLAKLRLNDAEGGKADIVAAKDINEEIDKIFERFGVQ